MCRFNNYEETGGLPWLAPDLLFLAKTTARSKIQEAIKNGMLIYLPSKYLRYKIKSFIFMKYHPRHQVKSYMHPLRRMYREKLETRMQTSRSYERDWICIHWKQLRRTITRTPTSSSCEFRWIVELLAASPKLCCLPKGQSQS